MDWVRKKKVIETAKVWSYSWTDKVHVLRKESGRVRKKTEHFPQLHSKSN